MLGDLLLLTASLAVAQGRLLQVGESRPFYNASNAALLMNTFDERTGAGAQHLRCYDSTNQVGRVVEIGNTAVADLSQPPYYFDNRIASCVFNGIYFLYDGYNFNSQANAAVYAETWGDNYKVNLGNFAYKASSVRLTGAPDGYKYDTFNTYQGEYYQGAEQYFYRDAATTRLDNFGQSLVVTGCNPWTAYEYNNFQGRGVCFYPADMMKCSPGFYRNAQFMGGMSNRISSVRKGCYSSIKVYGEALPKLMRSQRIEGNEGKIFNA